MPDIQQIGQAPDGTPLRGYEVDFETDKEPWSEYHLPDGTRVRVRNAIIKMYVVVDENDEPILDTSRNLQVFINGNVLIATTTPVKKGE